MSEKNPYRVYAIEFEVDAPIFSAWRNRKKAAAQVVEELAWESLGLEDAGWTGIEAVPLGNNKWRICRI